MTTFKYITATTVAIILAFVTVATMRVIDTPCQFEDSTNCIWIAPDSGNGIGQSFVDIFGVTLYLP